MSGHGAELAMLGYSRVSTAEQAERRYGLEAQEHAIRETCDRRGWWLVDPIIRDEGESGKSLVRPGLEQALAHLAAGDADGLIVAKLDRLSRSVVDFGLLLEWFTEAEATLVALDLGVDTSTPGGRLVANVFASVAEWERDTIAARTRDGLAALRAQGKSAGRPAVADRPELAERIRTMKAAGETLHEIAAQLNAEGVPTPRGGAEWRPSSLQTVLGYQRRRPRRRIATLPPVRPRVQART